MSVLTANQKNILSLLANEAAIANNFYLTGGTALAEFYLGHRLSDDLDFFSEKEVDAGAVSAVLKKIKLKVKIKSFRYEQSFNRNLFFLEIGNEIIKTEFTYFPFTIIEAGEKLEQLCIDSLIDIAVNKLFTIYQKPRSRDFIDLYCILEKQKEWTIANLIDKARAKFDYHIDPLQLASQFVKAETLKDYPTMLKKLKQEIWQKFFMKEATKLSAEQLEQ
ncbi:MAG: hypothetical protein A3D52_02845 [Candidatus Taylorbacteria bacterium RIFCSPHIGHO2_02_FULL_44_36]|uniref:Nucleotidyl transferase AbiEii toxin, Type IV TA system n=1 Tax=Candidatus Taylorbacteria bacterium RIFCSPLOWO2_12_FULL_44_15c TaxID=1802333 RepID=A0A1G2P5V9_9BACT|nr:MAG: hypothetical protein A3D52_02845 [Candidatus Taylorbacteria bacterium RIFCSPHIGHO2_02_FULL_44_36]OHA43099.1 MAG: hypothetical protein A3G03_02290 [Candidatus Taylorbacteria bacterium RIFCSPLOWO2_12_FULL_44_15c]